MLDLVVLDCKIILTVAADTGGIHGVRVMFYRDADGHVRGHVLVEV